MAIVEDVRSFNRFYTRAIGLLDSHLPASDLSLAQARVLFELARTEQTAADIARLLDMDKAHLSRVVARFRARGWVRARPNPAHRKQLLLSLTAKGARAFAALDAGTRAQIGALVEPLSGAAQKRLATAMKQIEATLVGGPAPVAPIHFRGLLPGDLGYITHRQAILYHREYGWDWTYEGLVADILGKFVAGFDAAREEAFVAERQGVVMGSVFLMKGDQPEVARLRLLYVEPEARGAGVGRQLVARCIDRARALGYARLTLWTNDVLVSARRIYVAAGFTLVDEKAHRSFGHELVGQTWALDLSRADAAK